MTEHVIITSCKKKGRFYFLCSSENLPLEKFHPDLIRTYHIKENKTFLFDEWESIKKENDYTFCMEKALRLLTRRPHSICELRRKLYKKKFSKNTISEVVDECLKFGYLDDENFAKLYLEELQQKNFGLYRIKTKMFEKGLDKELIEKLLQDFSKEDELERALKLYRRREKNFMRVENTNKRKQKIYSYFYRRGFSSDIISKIFELDKI